MTNPFFNANLYLAKNPDLVIAGIQSPAQLWSHYLNFGAQESLTNPVRAPNSWFDVSFYLTNNPDLGANGITAGHALDHYHQYGVLEGRLFNPNPNLAPANFGATTYAQNNLDLLPFFGITNPNQLSAMQAAQLQQHFLAYGYNEGRTGVTPSFANLVDNVNQINVDGIFGFPPLPTITYGTAADDAFYTDNNSTFNKVVNGLGGTDSFTFGAAATTGTGVAALALQNIEKVIVASTAGIEFQSNKLVHLQIDAGAGAVNARFDASVVAGQTDSLMLSSGAAATTLITAGIEHVSAQLDNNVTVFNVNANQVNGNTLLVDLQGGSNTGVVVNLESVGSTALTHLVIDGSALTNALQLNALGVQAQGVQHVTVFGSNALVNQNFVAVANSITLLAANGATLMVEGGLGDDVFRASNAIDTFRGMGGDDLYNFGGAAIKTQIQVAGGNIAAVDTLLDFTTGDKVNGVATQIVTGTGSVPINASLEQLVTGQAGALANGDVFGYGTDSYVLVAQNVNLAAVSLVKIVGVNINDLEVNAGVLEFA